MAFFDKKITRIILLAWLILYVLFLNSCGSFKGLFLTSALYEIEEIGSPAKEFIYVEYIPHKYHEHIGRVVGEVEKSGIIFNHFQFDNLLLPKSRVLEVFVPKNGIGNMQIKETNKKHESIGNAYLIDQCFCGDCCPCNADKTEFTIRTNGLGSEDFYYSYHSEKSNCLEGIYTTARISINWEKRNRVKYFLAISKLLYSIPLDFILLPVQPFFYAVYSV